MSKSYHERLQKERITHPQNADDIATLIIERIKKIKHKKVNVKHTHKSNQKKIDINRKMNTKHEVSLSSKNDFDYELYFNTSKDLFSIAMNEIKTNIDVNLDGPIGSIFDN